MTLRDACLPLLAAALLAAIISLPALAQPSGSSQASSQALWNEAGPAHSITASDGSTDPRILGVWRSRGYGWILDIGEDGVTRYQAGDSCYIPAGAGDLSEMASARYRLFREVEPGKVAVFQLLDGDTMVVFDRIDALPESCTEAPDPSPPAVASAFLDHFEQHYAFFERRGPGHEARAARLDGRITADMTEAELWDALGSYMQGLSDSHTKLIGSVAGSDETRSRIQDGIGPTLTRMRAEEGTEQAWMAGVIGGAASNLGDTARIEAGGRIIWGTIDGRVGYIKVFVMGGFSENSDFATSEWAAAEMAEFDRIMDEALSAFASLDTVIVDLSNNRGGWDQIAKALPARFTDTAFTGFTTEARGSGLGPYPHVIEPADGPRFSGPVYLMTSDVTVSGGELATLAFRQLPHVTQVGQTTRGAFSTPLAKPLPNGWLLELSNEVFAAPDGTVFEEAGIAPHVELEIYPTDDPVGGHWRAVSRVAQMAIEGPRR